MRYCKDIGGEKFPDVPTAILAMKFKTTITGRSLENPVEAVVVADNEGEARIKALRRAYGRRVCAFSPYNPLPGQQPSGQAGYAYERASAKSGASLAAASPLVRVEMQAIA